MEAFSGILKTDGSVAALVQTQTPEGNVDRGAEEVDGDSVHGTVPVQEHQQQLGSLAGTHQGKGNH